jgi:hypothetical protein
MAFGVPLKVIVVEAPEQIEVVPDMVAVGNELTVTVAEPDKVCGQEGAVANATLTKV